MRTRFLAYCTVLCIVFILVTPSCVQAKTYPGIVYTTNCATKVYTKASKSKVRTTLPKGKVVDVTGTKSDYYKINYTKNGKKRIGYVKQPSIERTWEHFIIPTENLDASNEVANFYSMCDEELRDEFERSRWAIQVLDSDLNELYAPKPGTKIVGLCYFDEKKILISESSPYSIVHEMGHYLDYRLGMISKTEQFQKIYELEMPKYCKVQKSTNTYNAGEYFAEFYYVSKMINLKEVCPNTCRFLELCIEHL